MKIINEFKEFAIKGNMIEMAIGIIIGASFNNVIHVLVKNILSPPLSLLSEGINFNQKKLILRNETENYSQVSIEYGLFMETLIDFLIVGFTIFVVVKFVNRLKNKADDLKDKSVSTPKDIALLNEIKLILKQQNDIIKNKCYKDLGEAMNFDNSMRQFHTTANTTIPNDQEAFAKSLYGNMPSCKDGDSLQCSKNNALLESQPSPVFSLTFGLGHTY